MGAMRRAYGSSPLINASRAQLRAIDGKCRRRSRHAAARFGDAYHRRAAQPAASPNNATSISTDPDYTADTKSIRSGGSVPRAAADFPVEQPIFDGFKRK